MGIPVENPSLNPAAFTALAEALNVPAKASQPEAEAGSNNTKTMTPLRGKQQIDARLADDTTPDTDSEKLSTPEDVVRRVVLNAQDGAYTGLEADLSAPQSIKERLNSALPDVYSFDGANIAYKAQNAFDYMATKGYGGTLNFPPEDYMFTDTVTVHSDNITLTGGGGADSSRILRASDFGPTFRFAKDDGQIINGFGARDLWFIDTNDSMTVANSPQHVEIDYAARGLLENLYFSQGTGAILAKGVNQSTFRGIRGSFPTGSPTGRSGMKFMKTAQTFEGSPVSFAEGGGHMMSDIDIQGGYGPGDDHLDYAYEFQCGDGFNLGGSIHAQWTALANMALGNTDGDLISNIYAGSGFFMDMCAGDGIVIIENVQALEILGGRISANGVGGASKHGIKIGVGASLSNSIIKPGRIDGWAGAPIFEDASAGTSVNCVYDPTLEDNNGFKTTLQKGTGWSPLIKSVAQNWASLAAGAADFVNVTVPGITTAYDLTANMDINTQGLIFRAWCDSPGNAIVLVENDRGFTIDLPAGILTVRGDRRRTTG